MQKKNKGGGMGTPTCNAPIKESNWAENDTEIHGKGHTHSGIYLTGTHLKYPHPTHRCQQNREI